MGEQHLTPGAQPPSAPGRTLAPEVTTLGEGGAAGTAVPEPLSPLVHLRAPSSRRSGGGGPGGARGQREEEAPSPAVARVQEAGAVLVPWGTSLGPEGFLRGARCRPPAPHLCRLPYGRRPLGGSGQGVGRLSRLSFSSRPGPAAELLVPAALAPPGSPGRGAERPWSGALSSTRTEGLLSDPPDQLQEEPVDPQPPPHQRGGSHLVAGRIQRQQGEGEGTARTSGAQRAEGGEQRC